MKIGFFTNTYLPNSYGSTVSIELFRRGLREMGHQVFVFTSAWKGYEDKDREVFRYPAMMSSYRIPYPISLGRSKEIDLLIDSLKLDVIHSHQPFSIGKDGLRQARRGGLPMVFTHHCRYEDYVHYLPPIVPQRLMKWWVKKRATDFSNQCNQVIAPSVSISRLIRERGVTRPIAVVPTGIETVRFCSLSKKEARGKLGFEERDLIILNTGRLDEEKNIFSLIEAVIPTMSRDKKIKLALVGDGFLKEEIEKRLETAGVSQQARLFGRVEYSQIHEYYCAADIFVHASLSETQGIIVNEAMAAGLAIAAVRATGPSDVLENGTTGLLVGEGQEELSGAIGRLVEDEKLRERLSKNARAQAQNLTGRSQAEKMERIYQNLLRK